MKGRESMQRNSKKLIAVAVLLLVAILSMTAGTKISTSTKTHAKTISALEDKKKTVLELTAASAAVSTAITFLPGDSGSTLAEKLMDLSNGFLIVLCALFLEKYLLTITGYATFMILIPVACILGAVWIFKRQEVLKRLAVKCVLLGLAIYLIVPASVKVSGLIEKNYQASIDSTIEAATGAKDETVGSTEDESLLDKIKDKVTGISDEIQNSLNNFIESLAVLLVTSCLIPLLVLGFFIWIIKAILGVNLNVLGISGR